MEYRILLLKNGKKKKTLFKHTHKRKSERKFRRFLKENQDVKFPRKHLTKDNISKVTYEIVLVKEYEDGDEAKLFPNRVGRLAPPNFIDGDWIILETAFYEIEETFYVFGYDSKSDRKDIEFIVGLMVKSIAHEKVTKTIVVLNNKLIIYNEYQFDIVICKCKQDAERLYDALLGVAKDNKLRRVLFMGKVSETTKSELYEMMMEHTGWDYRKVTRLSTNT
jgi:hypothetical protein